MSYNGYSDVSSYRSPVVTGWPTSAPPNQLSGDQSTNFNQQPYYGRPSYHQDEPESSSRLAFLYDRAYNAPPQQNISNQQYSASYQSRSPEGAAHNGLAAVHNSNGNTDNELPPPPPLPTSPPPSMDYQPMSRAMPAPMYQHGVQNDKQPIIRQTMPQASAGQQNGFLTPASQATSPTNVDHQMSRLALTERHPPPATGGASPARSRDVNGPSSRARAMPTSFARRQSAPGPCLPPNSRESTPTGARRQWAFTPCGFTNTRGQPSVANGRVTPSTPSEQFEGQRTPQSAVPRTADGPKLFVNGARSFGSQESFLDNENSQRDNGNSAIDTASIRYNLREGDEVSDYEQTSIRYTGKANPSKTFRLLQTATGSDSETDVKLAQAAMRRQVRRRRPTQEELEEADQPNADDIVDISYVGANIPSRTFRCLQEAIGARNPQGTCEMSDGQQQQQQQQQPAGRSVRVIHLRPAMKKHSSLDNILSCSDL